MSPEVDYDAFLSHSHGDAEWVERLGVRLEDECGFRIWLDKWILTAGNSWQQEMARGLELAKTCVACVGGETPRGWFLEEVQRALDRQANEPDFRVIPLLLPDASPKNLPAFLGLRTWVDFRVGQDAARAFQVLQQGIRGLPAGRWPGTEGEQQFIELKRFDEEALTDDVIAAELAMLAEWFDG